MAARALYFCSRLLNRELLPAFVIPTRLANAHQSTNSRDKLESRVQPTHAVATAEYYMSKSPRRSEFLADYKPLWDIRKQCGAVVRHEEMTNQGTDEGEGGQRSDKLLIVGNPNQVKLAFSLLNRELDLGEHLNTKQAAFREVYNPYNPFYEYEGKKLWEGYKRNFKGQYPPLKPRRDCRLPLRNQFHPKGQCGNPCSLCQMAYLYDYHVHFTDIEILHHFLCPHTGNLYPATRTNICRKQHDLLVAHVEKARLHGYLPLRLPAPSVERGKVRFKHSGLPTDRHVKHVRARSWKWSAYRSPKHHNIPLVRKKKWK